MRTHTSTNSQYDNILQGLDRIIDDYNDYTIMNDQQKSDRIQQRQHTLNVIIRKDKTKSDLANFLLASCFSPVKSTLLRAIKNNHFTTWPGMEYTFMNKHLSTNIATVKGHLNQERQHLQSTKENTNQVFIDDTATIAARIKK